MPINTRPQHQPQQKPQSQSQSPQPQHQQPQQKQPQQKPQPQIEREKSAVDSFGRDEYNVPLSLLTTTLALLVAVLLFRRLLSPSGGRAVRRHTALLLGLCGSGKTALLSQLITGRCVSTRTSMRVNCVSLSGAEGGAAVRMTDFPGHRRLREELPSALAEAKRVVLVVDAVMIQDDRHEGAQAVAELVVSVFTSPAFYGVQEVLVACSKRDELTSYSARAVRKLLEAEVGRCIATRRGDVQSVETVLNDAGVAVGRKRKRNNAGRAHTMELDESDRFSFDNFPVPVSFVDVSAIPQSGVHKFGVEEVRQFILAMG